MLFLPGADPAILKRRVPNPGQRGVPITCPHSNALIVQKKGVPTPGTPPLDPRLFTVICVALISLWFNILELR